MLRVAGSPLPAGGDDEPERLSRLRWLDSRLAQDDGLVPPYTPVVARGRTLSILGRTVELDASGFPRSIRSRFTPEVTSASGPPRELLAAPVALVRIRALRSATRSRLPTRGGRDGSRPTARCARGRLHDGPRRSRSSSCACRRSRPRRRGPRSPRVSARKGPISRSELRSTRRRATARSRSPRSTRASPRRARRRRPSRRWPRATPSASDAASA
ncbi:MAG: glycoside hydrolase domain-containing protein [Polyangiales bacterium]